ncbi:MAG: hypothetical protein MJ252_24635 [archaeon]|nr:hypothetical protein [archaeon]
MSYNPNYDSGSYPNEGNNSYYDSSGRPEYQGQTMQRGGGRDYNVVRQRGGSLRWREIMKLDLDQVQNNPNYGFSNAFIQSLINSSLTEDEIASVPESNIAKLVQIYQTALANQVNINQGYQNDISAMQNEIQELRAENLNQKTMIENNKDLLRNLKKDKRNYQMVIESYKAAIINLKKKSIKAGFGNENMYGYAPGQKIYNCKYCSNLSYASKEELNNHMNKIHQINISEGEIVGPMPEQMKMLQQINQKIDSISKSKEEGDKQKELEDIVLSARRKENEEQNKKLEEIQNYYTETLKIFKDLYLQSKNLPGQINREIYFQPAMQQSSPVPDESQLKNSETLLKVTESLDKITSNFENKLRDMENTMKNQMMEMQKMKEREKELSTIQADIQNRTVTQKDENIQLGNQTTVKINLEESQNIQGSTYDKNRSARIGKSRFNAGPLEKDNDEEDERKRKKKEELSQIRAVTSEIISQVDSKKPAVCYVPKQTVEQGVEIEFDQTKPEDNPLMRSAKENPMLTYYKRYRERDIEYLQTNQADKYRRCIVPQEVNPQEIMPKAADLQRTSFNNSTKKINSNFNFYSLADFQNLPTKALIDILRNTQQTVNFEKTQSKIAQDYCTGLEETFKIEEYEKYANSIMEQNEKREKQRKTAKKMEEVNYKLKEESKDPIIGSNNESKNFISGRQKEESKVQENKKEESKVIEEIKEENKKEEEKKEDRPPTVEDL